jgi:hypothetical protein
MDSVKLFSKVYEEKWQVEKVVSVKSIPSGNGPIITRINLIVHDIENESNKFKARIQGDDNISFEKWKVTLDIPLNEQRH